MAAAVNGAGSAVDATVAKLLNYAEPLDVALLDATVNAFYGAGSNEEVRILNDQLHAERLPIVDNSSSILTA
jgi:hypothetical protein